MKTKIIGILVMALLIPMVFFPSMETIKIEIEKKNIEPLLDDKASTIDKLEHTYEINVPNGLGAEDDNDRDVTKEAIVGFYGPLPFYHQNIATKIASRHGITLRDTNPTLCAALYENVDNNTLKLLLKDPDVKYAERNGYVSNHSVLIPKTLDLPNDPYFGDQWALWLINADLAWQVTTGNTLGCPKVAVIDSGIDASHPDLTDNYLPLGIDHIDHDNFPDDRYMHGTHCAGIIGAVGNNDFGITGVCWDVDLIVERALDEWGDASNWEPAFGITHAVDVGADILSNSWGCGSEYTTQYYLDALRYAWDRNCFIVFSSGNHGRVTAVEYPAYSGEACAVGAIKRNKERVSYSSYGAGMELMAPGYCILSTMPTYDTDSMDEISDCTWEPFKKLFDEMQGTSMAAPHVSGVGALVWDINPDLNNMQVRRILQETAEDLGPDGCDLEYGHGLVNAFDAVYAAQDRISVSVSPDYQIIEPDGSVVFDFTVAREGGTPGNPYVTLELDPMYPLDDSLDATLSTTDGVPTFSGTITIEADTEIRENTYYMRLKSTYEIEGIPIDIYSNFFTIYVNGPPEGDRVWIKTCNNDDGSEPVTADNYWISPDITSDPYPPEIGKTNKIFVTVRNKGDVKLEDVHVTAWGLQWTGFIPNPSDISPLGTEFVDIDPYDTATAEFEWWIPTSYQAHICCFAQAYRPGLEEYKNQFDVVNSNNIAQRNFAAVEGSDYKTTLLIKNPTDSDIVLDLCAEPPNTDWAVDFCRPAYLEDKTVVTPLFIEADRSVNLSLTIKHPDGEGGRVHLWCRNINFPKLNGSTPGFPYIYPNVSHFTYEIIVLDINIPKGFTFGVKSNIRNLGNTPLQNIEWEININAPLMLIGSKTSGVIDVIPVDEEVTIKSSFILGFGPCTIVVTADNVTRSATGFVFGPFIFGVK